MSLVIAVQFAQTVVARVTPRAAVRSMPDGGAESTSKYKENWEACTNDKVPGTGCEARLEKVTDIVADYEKKKGDAKAAMEGLIKDDKGKLAVAAYYQSLKVGIEGMGMPKKNEGYLASLSAMCEAAGLKADCTAFAQRFAAVGIAIFIALLCMF